MDAKDTKQPLLPAAGASDRPAPSSSRPVPIAAPVAAPTTAAAAAAAPPAIARSASSHSSRVLAVSPHARYIPTDAAGGSTAYDALRVSDNGGERSDTFVVRPLVVADVAPTAAAPSAA